MRIRPEIAFIILIVLSALSSCRAISSLFNEEDVVAEVNGVTLSRAELDKVIPRGIMPEDSARLARQYITRWASDRIYQKKAEEKLSAADKDVSKELEEYRQSLLKYRYEQLYVNERLDTNVTDEQIQDYYEAHLEKFVLERPIVKARYLDIGEDSPMLGQIKKRMSSKDVNDFYEADSLAYSSAYKFETWEDDWIDIIVLAREYSVDYSEIVHGIKNGWMESVDTTGRLHLAYISGMMRKGETAPLDFCTERIKDIILSVRKHELLLSLEQELLEDARKNGQFVIY